MSFQEDWLRHHITARPTKDHLLGEIKCIQVSAIGQFVCARVLPGNHSEKIKVDPPDKEKREVKSSQTRGTIVLLGVGLQSQGRHHRNYMEEKNNISNERLGDLLTQDNFDVSP